MSRLRAGLVLVSVAVLVATSLPARLLGACAVVPSQPIAWWPAEGNANDVAGSHNGTLAGGATFGAGEVLQAFQFDGVNAVVSVPDDPAWSFPGDFTIDAWVRIHVVTGTNVFLGHDNGPGTVNKWIFWVNGGNLQLHLNGPAVGAVYIGVPFAPVVDTWYHLAVTRTGSTYRFYVNGAQTGGDQANATVIPTATAPLTIGKAESLASLNGWLDEVDVYNVALSAADIAGIYSAGTSGKCAAVPVTLQSIDVE